MVNPARPRTPCAMLDVGLGPLLINRQWDRPYIQYAVFACDFLSSVTKLTADWSTRRGLLPWTPLGSLQHSPRFPSWRGGGWLPSIRTLPPVYTLQLVATPLISVTTTKLVSYKTTEKPKKTDRAMTCSANLLAMYVFPVPLDPQRMIRRWSSNSDTYLCRIVFGTSVSNASESTLLCSAPAATNRFLDWEQN